MGNITATAWGMLWVHVFHISQDLFFLPAFSLASCHWIAYELSGKLAA